MATVATGRADGIVRVNGIDLKVNRFRTGNHTGPTNRPLVVFVHGYVVVDHSGLSLTLGMPLSRDADVILYALRGHGRSQFVRSGYGIQDHVADLVALLDSLDVAEPVHLVGCSFGGVIASVAAMQHPERFASLILLDPLLPVDGWTESAIADLETMTERLRHGYSSEEAMQVLGWGSRRRATALVKRVRRLLFETTIIDDLRAEHDYAPEDFARISCPVRAIFGDQSKCYRLADTLRELVPGTSVHTIADADHLDIFFLRSAEVRALIRRFVGVA